MLEPKYNDMSKKVELSSDEKLELLSRWMKHYTIENIAFYHNYGSPKRIKKLGAMFYNSNPYITFEEYCKNILFLNLI